MLPKGIPYSFDNMPDENYFGEFRDLSSSIGPNTKKDRDHDNADREDSDEIFDEFSIHPKF